MDSKPSVLFLCTGNSCRSQIAEAFLRERAGDRFGVYSAGLRPEAGIHPLAIEVMAERNIDLSTQRPKGVEEFLGRLAVLYLIVVCDATEDDCPRIFPGAMQRAFWPVDDPAAFTGTHEGVLEKFRVVRDEIEDRITTWLEEQSE